VVRASTPKHATPPIATGAWKRISRDSTVARGKRGQTEASRAGYGHQMAARFLTMQDVADELATSLSQVYHMVRSGELPAIKIGGRGQWRIERSKLEAYIQQKYDETAKFVRNNPLIERGDGGSDEDKTGKRR
jgi:excisionase family DNA binding protein